MFLVDTLPRGRFARVRLAPRQPTEAAVVRVRRQPRTCKTRPKRVLASGRPKPQRGRNSTDPAALTAADPRHPATNSTSPTGRISTGPLARYIERHSSKTVATML